MFEYLKFGVGGYFSGYRTIEIKNNNSELEIIFDDVLSTLGVETSCPDDGWTDKLASLKIEEWKDEYFRPCCDGTQWELEYKLEGKNAKCIDGSNDYPVDWMKLIDLLEVFHPAIDFLCHDDENEGDEELEKDI